MTPIGHLNVGVACI